MFSGALTPTPACTHSSRQLAGCQWETLSVQVHHVPGPGHLVLLLQTGDVVYRLPPTRSDAKAGVARTRRQVECPHRDPRPPRLLAGDLPEMGSGSAGLACPQLPCTRGFSSAFWLLHLRVHSRPKTTRHHWKALIQNVQSRQENDPEETHVLWETLQLSRPEARDTTPTRQQLSRSDVQQSLPLAIKTPTQHNPEFQRGTHHTARKNEKVREQERKGERFRSSNT